MPFYRPISTPSLVLLTLLPSCPVLSVLQYINPLPCAPLPFSSCHRRELVMGGGQFEHVIRLPLIVVLSLIVPLIVPHISPLILPRIAPILVFHTVSLIVPLFH